MFLSWVAEAHKINLYFVKQAKKSFEFLTSPKKPLTITQAPESVSNT